MMEEFYQAALLSGDLEHELLTDVTKRLVRLVEVGPEESAFAAWDALEEAYGRAPGELAPVLASSSSTHLRAWWLTSTRTLKEHLPLAARSVEEVAEEAFEVIAETEEMGTGTLEKLWPHLGPRSRLALLEPAFEIEPTDAVLTWLARAHEDAGMSRPDFLDWLDVRNEFLTAFTLLHCGEVRALDATFGLKALHDCAPELVAQAIRMSPAEGSARAAALLLRAGETRRGLREVAEEVLAVLKGGGLGAASSEALVLLEEALAATADPRGAHERALAEKCKLVSTPQGLLEHWEVRGWGDRELIELMVDLELSREALVAVAPLLADKSAAALEVLERAGHFKDARGEEEARVSAFLEVFGAELRGAALTDADVLAVLIASARTSKEERRELLLSAQAGVALKVNEALDELTSLVLERSSAEVLDVLEVLSVGFEGSLGDLLEVARDAAS
jgi:hypothetical protein